MKEGVLLFEHLFHFEGFQAVDQWLQGGDEDGFVRFVPGVDQLETRADVALLEPNHDLNCQMLLLYSFLFGMIRVHLLPWGMESS